jgi:tetratricopeptide (TPR) repeat protein
MKNILKCLFLLCLGLISSNMMAQIKIPQLSPAAKVEQQIGLAKATITYSRPSLRGRKLLGQNDIPYGKVWRMGANEVTTLELSDDMLIEGKALAKGKYAFVAIPDASEWTIVVNSASGQWGVYGYKEEKDVLRFKVKAEVLSPTAETLCFTFEDTQPSAANIVFRWENVQFKVGLSQDTDTKVMAEIKQKTANNPNGSTLMEAAEYYLMMNRDLEQALIWSNQVLEKTKSPFRYNLKAQIAQKLGKCEVATEAAKWAIQYAEKNGDAAAKALAENIIKSCEGKK